MKDYLFVSQCDGSMYDTRVNDWHKLPALRENYNRHHKNIRSIADLKATLRAGKYTDLGGYPLFLLTQDGGTLCFDCAQKELRQIVWDYMNDCSTGWRVIACDINHEDSELCCDHCYEKIESAYCEEESDNE